MSKLFCQAQDRGSTEYKIILINLTLFTKLLYNLYTLKKKDSMKNIQLGPYEKIADKPFTDLNHSLGDLARLIKMTHQLVDSYDDPERCDYAKRRAPVIKTDSHGNEFKIFYIRPKKLFNHKNICVVGFFGLRRPDADIAPLLRADKELTKMYYQIKGLLSLSTTELQGAISPI
jgi:hypothetical protein